MPFPAPALPIVGPALAALVVLLFGRWPRVQAIIGTAAALTLAYAIATLSLNGTPTSRGAHLFSGNTWLLAGRPLVMSAGLQDLFVFFFVALALLFLITLSFSQGSTFVPAGLAAISPLAAALMVQLLAFGAILLVITVALLVMTYSPVVCQKAQGSLRYLLFFVLALAPLLLAGWLFESGQAALYTPFIVAMLAAAFAILMAGFPFYIWVYPIVAEAPFLVPALLFGLAQTAVIAFIFPLLQANPWLPYNSQFQNWLTWSGIGTVMVAALLVLTAGQWRFLLGHLLLLNMGMAVLTLTLPAESAWDIAFLFHLSRFGSLLLAGTALSFLQRQGQGDSIAASQGFGWRAPLSVALLAYSLFSLLGTPLTFGFPAQWAVISTFGQQSNLWLSVLLVLALGISAYRVVRVLASLIQKDENERVQLESGWQRVLLTAMLIISFLLALFPRPLLSLALGISAAFSG